MHVINVASFHAFNEDQMVTVTWRLIFTRWCGLILTHNRGSNGQELTMAIDLLRTNHSHWSKIKRRSNGLWLGSLIRVILLTVILWRIRLIVVPPISIILQGIVKNRGIILVRIITWIIWSSLLTWSSWWTFVCTFLALGLPSRGNLIRRAQDSTTSN